MKYVIALSLLLLSVTVMSVKAVTIESAKNAYFHRDYQRVKDIIKELKVGKAEDNLLMAELEILKIAVDIHHDVDDADDDLEIFLENNPNNANFHYLASILWYQYAQNVSIFSKRSMYKNHVLASIKAGELAPENERYQYRAARAYGQPSILGGNSDKQKPIVEKLMISNSAFAQMAMMDYLQNTQDKDNAFIFIEQAVKAFKGNIEVIERAAQLLWTFEKKEQAGKLFTDVCLLTPGEFEAFVKWSDACITSAYFALDGTVDKAIGLLTIERLIEFTEVNDEDYQYALLTREKLILLPD